MRSPLGPSRLAAVSSSLRSDPSAPGLAPPPSESAARRGGGRIDAHQAAAILAAPASGSARHAWGAAVAVMFVPALLLPVLSARITSDQYLEEALAFQERQSIYGVVARYVTWILLVLLAGMLVPRLRNIRLARPGFALWGAAAVFSCAVLVSACFAFVPHLPAADLVPPLAVTLAFVLPPIEPRRFLRLCQAGILVAAYGSLVAMAVAPSWALDLHYYEGLIPGFTVRLHGLATHANTLAPLLVLFLLADLGYPTRTWRAWLNRCVVLFCLVMTQSKTAWLLAVAGALIHAGVGPWSAGKRRIMTLVVGAVVVVVGVILVSTASTFVQLPWESESVRDLTGRTPIWLATLDVWRRNPLFGYGPDLWNASMTSQYLSLVGLATAHAHNQWVQTLGESGLMGAVPLLLYCSTLLVYAVRYGAEARGVALTWTAVILLRTITETPMRASVGDGTFQMQFLLFALLSLCSQAGTTPAHCASGCSRSPA